MSDNYASYTFCFDHPNSADVNSAVYVYYQIGKEDDAMEDLLTVCNFLVFAYLVGFYRTFNTRTVLPSTSNRTTARLRCS